MAADGGTRPVRALGVLLCCPHRLEREGLRLAIEQDEDIEVVGSAQDIDEAAFLVRRPTVQVAVVGWGWTQRECLDAIARIHGEREDLPLLVVSADVHIPHVQAAIEAGARGFLPADIEIDDLIHGLRTAARDDELVVHRSLAPAFLAHLASASAAHPPRGSFEALTPREREVVRLLARGLSDRDLAQSLFISVRTVQTHLSHIYAKLGVHTRTEVALMAVREGWASIASDTDPGPRLDSPG